MITVQLSKTERIRITDGWFETERRHADSCDDGWKNIACHSNATDAAADYVQLQIRCLPNEDLNEFARGAERIMAAVTQIFAVALESGQGSVDQRQVV